MINYIVQSTSLKIAIPFLVKGRTGDHVDVVYSMIQCQTNCAKICVPWEWVTMIGIYRPRAKLDIFISFDIFINFIIDERFEIVLNWIEVSMIQFEKRSPNILKFKRGYSKKMFSYVNLLQVDKGHDMKTAELRNLSLQYLVYSNELPKSSEKYDKLQFFCQENIRCTYMISIKT